jgi:hypothetical protein
MYFGREEGINVCALQTSTEQIGHRVRTITTGGRPRRRAKDAEIDNCVTYLDQVADDLERHGFVVDSVAVDGRRPISGRVSIRDESGRPMPGVGTVMTLSWQRDFGWSASTFESDAPPNGWFHLYADDAAEPAEVTGFVLTQLIPKNLSSRRMSTKRVSPRGVSPSNSDDPDHPAVAS